jgi:phosphohistidine phosphatase
MTYARRSHDLTSPRETAATLMSKRLYLLRHAKSSWKHPELTDHERPLAGRGRRAAKAIARHLDEYEIAPELVLCSTARRARETFERIEPALLAAAVKYELRLYAATADALLERVHSVPDGVASVMLIGHNPAIEQLALELARPSPKRRELETKFPTQGDLRARLRLSKSSLEVDARSRSGLGPTCPTQTRRSGHPDSDSLRERPEATRSQAGPRARPRGRRLGTRSLSRTVPSRQRLLLAVCPGPSGLAVDSRPRGAHLQMGMGSRAGNWRESHWRHDRAGTKPAQRSRGFGLW